MRAIVLWEPWATLMALNIKRNETRGWWTNHRGELAICAAKRKPEKFVLDGMDSLGIFEGHKPVQLSAGCVVCVVKVVSCWAITEAMIVKGLPLELKDSLTTKEQACGDYSPGRYAWLTRDCRRLREPVPVTGRQGLFNLPPAVEAAVRRQL